jgi:hypothetical protein
VLVVLDLQELAGAVDDALGEAAVPRPHGDVGDRVLVAGEVLGSARRRSSTSSWRLTSMAKRSIAYSILVGA